MIYCLQFKHHKDPVKHIVSIKYNKYLFLIIHTESHFPLNGISSESTPNNLISDC